MGIDTQCLISPDPPPVGEVANKFLFLGVYADNGKTCRQESIAYTGYLLKLPVAVWMGRSSESLAVSKERDSVFFKRRRIVLFDAPNPFLRRASCSLDRLRPVQTSRLSGLPALWASTISKSVFSTRGFFSSIFLRPPPDLRTRPDSLEGSSPRSSLRPRPIVSMCKPVTSASFVCPPRSKQRESNAVTCRRCFSSHVDRIPQSISCQRGSLSQGAPVGSKGTWISHHDMSIHVLSAIHSAKIEVFRSCFQSSP
jgi:hypothetical protein